VHCSKAYRYRIDIGKCDIDPPLHDGITHVKENIATAIESWPAIAAVLSREGAASHSDQWGGC